MRFLLGRIWLKSFALCKKLKFYNYALILPTPSKASPNTIRRNKTLTTCQKQGLQIILISAFNALLIVLKKCQKGHIFRSKCFPTVFHAYWEKD